MSDNEIPFDRENALRKLCEIFRSSVDRHSNLSKCSNEEIDFIDEPDRTIIRVKKKADSDTPETKEIKDCTLEDISKLFEDVLKDDSNFMSEAFSDLICNDETIDVISKITGVDVNNWFFKSYGEFEKSKDKKKAVIFTFENTYPKYYTDVIDSFSLENIYGDAVDSDIYPVVYSWIDPEILKNISYKYEDLPDHIKLLVTEDELKDYIPGQQIGHTIFSIPVKIEKFNDNDDGWKRQISFFESIIIRNAKILLTTQLDINLPPPDTNFFEILCCKFYYHSIISIKTDKRRMVCLENDKKELTELAEYIRKYGIIGKEGDKNLASFLLTSSYTAVDKSTLFKHPEVPYLTEKIPHIIDMDSEERDKILNRKATSIKVYRNIGHEYPHVIAYFDDTKESYDIAMSRREFGNPWTSVKGYIKDTMTKFNGPALQQPKPSYSAEKRANKRVLKLISQEVLAEDVDEDE